MNYYLNETVSTYLFGLLEELSFEDAELNCDKGWGANPEFREEIRNYAREIIKIINTNRNSYSDIVKFQCPKCKLFSGDSWEQCKKKCPVEGSPHFDETTYYNYGPLRKVEHK